MIKMKYIITAILLIFLAASSTFAGGGKRNGTAGASELLIPVGAQGLAMGGAALTNLFGIEALFWNPANITRSPYATDAMFSHMAYFADMGVTYGAITTNIEGLGTLGFSIKTLSIGEIEKTTIPNSDGTGQFFTPQFVTIGLTYANQLSDRIAVGITGNLISETIDLVSATGFAFNVGLSYQNLANIEGLSLGLTIKNLGPQMQFDGSGLYVNSSIPDIKKPKSTVKLSAAPFELPSILEIGFGYEYRFDEINNLKTSFLFQNHNFDGDAYRVGAEYSYDNLFFVRGGYTISPELDADYNIYDFTLGAGVNYDLGDFTIKFDYAFQNMKYFGGNNVFALTMGL